MKQDQFSITLNVIIIVINTENNILNFIVKKY